jgi:predicted nucleic acid-binding protein
MSKTIVDTNILLRLLLRDDPKGLQEAESFLKAANANACVVTTIVSAEVLHVLRILGYEREKSAGSFIDLLLFPQFATEAYILESLRLYQEKTLDFVDCYLIVAAIREGIELKTLDKKAAKVFAVMRST